MRSSAVISDDTLHRVVLYRIWDDALPQLVVCMLNPSTADHTVNDPTVLALIHFARFWGYGGLRIINLFSFRASKPADMVGRPVHPDNEMHQIAAVTYAADHGGQMLVAWGNGGGDAGTVFAAWAGQCVMLVCLGVTQSGAPKHPMARGLHRIPRDQVPLLWA